MSHTPGPWKVDSSMISTGWVLVTKSNGDVVANVNTETWADIPPLVSIKMPALANARIISAAPDLLEALETMERLAGTPMMMDDPARVAAFLAGFVACMVAIIWMEDCR